MRILVGSEEQSFFVHAAILTATSEFFTAALKKEWKKVENSPIKLPKEKIQTFELYVRWLYAAQIYTKTEGDSHNYEVLAELYALGERLIDPMFRNCVMNAFLAGINEYDKDGKTWWPIATTATFIYRNTPSDSPARRFIVDCFVKSGEGTWITEYATYLRR